MTKEIKSVDELSKEDELEFLLRRLRELLDWQDINDAPRDGTKILGVVRGFEATVIWYRDGYWWNQLMDESKRRSPGQFDPTHWLPIPPTPTWKADWS